MAKKRTRKDKETAKHTYTISWDPSSEATSVKSQNQVKLPQNQGHVRSLETANSLAQLPNLASIQGDILKSIFISIFIIAFEIVIYFFWK